MRSSSTFETLLRGWLAALVVLSAASCERTLSAYPDEFAGAGLVLKSTAQGFVVSELVSDGPASEAGIRVGATLDAIDGRPVNGRTLASVVDQLRGRPDSEVILTMVGAGGTRETYTLHRRQLVRADAGYAPH